MIAVNVGSLDVGNILKGSENDFKLPIDLEKNIEVYKIKTQEKLDNEKISDMENHSIFHVLNIAGTYLHFIENLVEENDKNYLNIVKEIKNIIFSYRENVSDISKTLKNIDNFGRCINKLSELDFLNNEYNFIILEKSYEFISKKSYFFRNGYENKYKFKNFNIDYIIESLKEPNEFFYNSDLKVVFNKNEKTEYNYFIKIDYESIYGNKFDIPFSLIEVIVNLVFNSRKNSEKGSNIYLSLNQTENNIHLEVIDEGKGIAENMLEKIFKTGVSSKKSGSGLGLPKVNYVVNEKLGGEINIKTKEGVGTYFYISIPYKKEEA